VSTVGVKRELGTSQDCKAPITPELLLKFKSILDLDCHNNIVFWAACLTGFYGTLQERSKTFEKNCIGQTAMIRQTK
jgi:hypothetical protein